MTHAMSIDFYNFFQLGFVCADIAAGAETLKRMYGVPEFWMGPRGTVHSADGPMEVDGAVAFVGNVQIELLAPAGRADAVYRDFVPPEPGGVRLHHCCHLIDSQQRWEQLLTSVAASGLATPIRGQYLDLAHYLYIDTRATLGHYTEFLYQTEAGRDLFKDVPRYRADQKL